jgi:hypothetical protein
LLLTSKNDSGVQAKLDIGTLDRVLRELVRRLCRVRAHVRNDCQVGEHTETGICLCVFQTPLPLATISRGGGYRLCIASTSVSRQRDHHLSITEGGCVRHTGYGISNRTS